jgi:hypothetical protein
MMIPLWEGTRMIVRIYTGQDGQTHFEDLPLPTERSHNVAVQEGTNLVFRCFPADYSSQLFALSFCLSQTDGRHS